MKINTRLQEIRHRLAQGQYIDSRTKDDVQLLMQLVDEFKKTTAPFARIALLPQDSSQPLVYCYKEDCQSAMKLLDYMDKEDVLK